MVGNVDFIYHGILKILNFGLPSVVVGHG